jgi:hypothetical protein
MQRLARRVKRRAARTPIVPPRGEHDARPFIHNDNTRRNEVSAMQYAIVSLSGSDAVETLEAHVLARAYRTMWRARHGSEPAGPHVIASLDLVIEFGARASVRRGRIKGQAAGREAIELSSSEPVREFRPVPRRA